MAVNTHPDCEPIQQTVQNLTQQIEEIDFRIGALEAEALITDIPEKERPAAAAGMPEY